MYNTESLASSCLFSLFVYFMYLMFLAALATPTLFSAPDPCIYTILRTSRSALVFSFECTSSGVKHFAIQTE